MRLSWQRSRIRSCAIACKMKEPRRLAARPPSLPGSCVKISSVGRPSSNGQGRRQIRKRWKTAHGKIVRSCDQERPSGAPQQGVRGLSRYCGHGWKDRATCARYPGRASEAGVRRQEFSSVPRLRRCSHAYRHLCAPRPRRGFRKQSGCDGRRNFKPEVLKQSEGRFWVDYGYHIAPIEADHIDEMEHLALDYGIPSFKIFMFYGGYGLHGRSANQNEFLMIGPEDRYDIAHFEFIMRSAQQLMTKYPKLSSYISFSLHC